jgi:hypothetical protein
MQRRHQLGRLGVLEQVADGARLQGVGHPLTLGERGEDDDLGVRPLGEDLPRRLGAVEQGHREVHQDQVRLQLPSQLDGFAPVAGLGHHLELGVGGQQRRQAGSHELVIVHQHHPGHRPATFSSHCVP